MSGAGPPPREPVFTPRLQLGFGLLAFGLGLMFLAGKVLPAPVPAAIAGGITLAIAGFVVVVVEALRDPAGPPEESAASGDDGPAASGRSRPGQSRYAGLRRVVRLPRFWKHSRQ